MANKSVGELVSATRVTPTDLFVLEQSGTAKKLTGQILENWLVAMSNGHGGIQSIAKLSTSGLVDTYRITLTDKTTFDFTVTNGRGIKSWEKSDTSGLVDTYTMTLDDGTEINYTVKNGEQGEPGAAGTVWIKYASQEPTEESHSIGDIPDDWIGICPGQAVSDSAPADWREYTWFLWKGRQGEPGAVGKSGLSIFYTSDDHDPVTEGTDYHFDPDLIEVVTDSDVRVGDMLLTPSGKLFRVRRLPYGGVIAVQAMYLTTIKGKDGVSGQNGLSIFPVNSESTDVDATFQASDIKTFGRAPQVGELLLTPNGRVFQIYAINGESYSAGFFSSIRGPSGLITQEERDLMMALFKNATYSQPMTDTLNTLARLWGFLITVSFYDSLALGGYVGTLECPKGMTWGEFVTSEYNTKGFRFIDRYLHAEDGWLVQGVQRSSTGSYYFTITQDIEVGKFPEYTYDFPNL